MKKFFKFLLFIIILHSCSLDNKTGIWNDSKYIQKVKKIESKDIKNLNKNKKFKIKCAFIKKKIDYEICLGGELAKKNNPKLKNVFVFDRPINFEKKVDLNSKKFLIEKPLKNINWLQENYSNFNNISNFYYLNTKERIFRSRTLSKSFSNSNLDYFKPTKPLVFNDNIISFDQKGKIYFYSIKNKKKLWEYNFYKTKFKNYKKLIYLHIYNNVIYAADNLGYLYALELETGNLIWAKNFGIPFRSNIKIIDNQIFLANQDNIVYAIDLEGEIIWQFATSLTFLKTDFFNSIILDEDASNLIFYNTSGELYSINIYNQKINWVINTVSLGGSGSSGVLLSVPIIANKNNVYVYNGNSLSSYSKLSSQKNWSLTAALKIKPVISGNNLYIITKNNFLACLDSTTGEVLWSTNVYNSLNIKDSKIEKKFGIISNLIIAQNEIFLFTSKGQIFSFNFNDGSLISNKKILKSGLSTDPILSDGYLYVFDRSYRIYKFK